MQKIYKYPQILLSLVFFGAPELSLAKIKERSDLKVILSKYLCQASSLDSDQLWSESIYDADISIRVLTKKTTRPHSDRVLKQLSIRLAQSQKHLGYSYGICSKQRAWIASTPAPVPLKIKQNLITLELKSLTSFCRKTTVMNAKFKNGRGILVPELRAGVYKIPEPMTMTSISCLPKRPSPLGYQPWYLVSLNSLPKMPPHYPSGKKLGDADRTIIWINHIRRSHGLANLQKLETKFVRQSYKELIASKSIIHNRPLLLSIKERLTHQQIDFIGENRVIGASIKERLRLLWFSPRHRNLLLNKKATHLFVQDETPPLSVIMFFKQTKLSSPSETAH